MLSLWKFLFILALNIAFVSKVADGTPTFALTRRILCRLNRRCSYGREVPGSNPTPAAPATPSTSPSNVPGAVLRRTELLLSVANLACFIDVEINRNPSLAVVRLDLKLQYGLDLPALAAGKLAGESVHELVRVLAILSEVLSLVRKFPCKLPEHPGTSTIPSMYSTATPDETRGVETNRPEPTSSSSTPATTMASPSEDKSPEPPRSSFDSAVTADSPSEDRATEAKCPEVPSSSSSSSADTTTTSSVTTTTATSTATLERPRDEENHPEPSRSSPATVPTTTPSERTTKKPNEPYQPPYINPPPRPDSGPPQYFSDEDYYHD